MIIIETDRLILRTWQDTDIPLLVAMNQDKEVMRFFPSLRTEQETIRFANEVQQEYEEHGYGLWAVECKLDGQFIGFVGLHRAKFEADFTPCIEIGWRLRKEYWHMGYASEAARACIQYGFDVLKLDEIYSFTAQINTPSQAVMQRIGMQYIGKFSHPNVNINDALCLHVLYVSRKPK